MKKFGTKIAAAALALCMAVGMLTGCNTNKSEQSQKKVFTYDGTDVYLDEAWVYAKITQTTYESYYMSTFGSSMWTMEVSQDDEGNPVTFEAMAKESVIAQIKQVKVLVNQAKELKIELTSEEEKEAKEAAEAFCGTDEGKAILKETGANEDTILKIYQENALAAKVQEEMVKDVDTEVSDDEARKTSVYKLVFETTKTDSETGSVSDMSADEKKEQKDKAEKALKDIQGGKSIEDVAEELEMTDSATETYSAGESKGGKKFEATIAKLKDGEVADKVLTTDEGYVVVKLVAYTDEDATAEEKESIINDRKSELYQKNYEELIKDLEEEWNYDEDVDQDAWALVKFATEEATTETEETTTVAEEGTTGAEETTTAAEEGTTVAEEATTAE